MSDIEVDSPIEKPTTGKKKDWVLTEARRLTLEKGRNVRSENIKKIQQDKAVQNLEKQKQKLNEKQSKIIDGLIPPKVKKPRQKLVSVKEISKEEKPSIRELDTPPPPTPPAEPILDDSSDTSSDSSVELIIRRKSKQSATSKATPVARATAHQAPTMKQHFFL